MREKASKFQEEMRVIKLEWCLYTNTLVTDEAKGQS